MGGVLNLPRYKENPIYIFFEGYILDVIGKFPSEKAASFQEMNLQKIFKTKATEWRHIVQEVLGLSPTIDTAILDLWIRNGDCYFDNEEGYRAYAQDFTDNYMKDGSKVDVWSPETLLAAEKRVQLYRNKHLGL